MKVAHQWRILNIGGYDNLQKQWHINAIITLGAVCEREGKSNVLLLGSSQTLCESVHSSF